MRTCLARETEEERKLGRLQSLLSSNQQSAVDVTLVGKTCSLNSNVSFTVIVGSSWLHSMQRNARSVQPATFR